MRQTANWDFSRMSQQSRSGTAIPPTVENSDGSAPTYYSRNSIILNSYSNDNSGQFDVVMNVGANWSSKSTLAPIIPNRYWRNRIAIVLIPFVLSGAPVLQTLTQNDHYFATHSTVKWLKSLLTNYLLLPLNIILLLLTLFINFWSFYLLLDMVISLFILGEVPKNFMDVTYELIEIMPIVIPVDLFWLKGYVLKDVINQFDYISLETVKMSPPGVTIKILFIYFITFGLHIIGYFTYKWKLKYGYTSESVREYLEHLPHRVLSTFLPPLYITFCCAIHYKYRCMNDYIKGLLDSSEKPQILHFRTIKALYKRNANLICRINAAFSLVMSAFFLVILLGIVRDCIHTFYMVLAYMAYSKAYSETNTNGSTLFELNIMKEMVRCVSADVLIIIIKIILIGLTILQMINVNDESRTTGVNINDFVTQFNHEMPTALYHSFRLLKCYTTSRMERSDNPSLLTIMLFTSIPVIRTRLLARMPS